MDISVRRAVNVECVDRIPGFETAVQWAHLGRTVAGLIAAVRYLVAVPAVNLLSSGEDRPKLLIRRDDSAIRADEHGRVWDCIQQRCESTVEGLVLAWLFQFAVLAAVAAGRSISNLSPGSHKGVAVAAPSLP